MPQTRTLIIRPGVTAYHYWSDLWRYRELFYVLAWRDISVRYKQTLIGLAWALIRPFVTMIVFTIIFSRIANLETEGAAPYALMVYVGLMPWQFFSSALSESSNSLLSNSNLIGKVYFPRLIIPAASVVVSLVDFLIGFIVLIGMMLWYSFIPGWQILVLPFLIMMCFLASLGIGLWAATLNMKYRDFRYIIPFVLQIGLYISPVGFSSTVIPEKWKLLYSLNPMVGIIDGFRWAILGGDGAIYLPGMLVGSGVIFIFLFIGIRQFRRMEKSFADLI